MKLWLDKAFLSFSGDAVQKTKESDYEWFVKVGTIPEAQFEKEGKLWENQEMDILSVLVWMLQLKITLNGNNWAKLTK